MAMADQADLSSELLHLDLGSNVGEGVAELPSTTQSQGALAKRGTDATLHDATPKKKQRKATQYAASPGPSSCKTEIEDAADVALIADLGEEGCEIHDDEKVCAGCARSSVHGRCFIRPDERLSWALPHSRGAWCRDCLNVWRLWFIDRMHLVTLPRHLKLTAGVQTDFDLALIAYVSLRRQGVERISKSALSDRIDLIKWLAATLGIPSFGFMVVPLSEVSSLHSDRQLLTMKTSNGYEVAAMVEKPVAPSNVTIIQRQHDGFSMGLASRTSIFTQKGSDAARIQELLGDGLTARPVCVKKAEIDVLMSPSQLQSKCAKKVVQKARSAISSAALVLHNFESAEWEEVRESSFSAPLAKLTESKMEAAHEQLETVIEQCAIWHAGLINAKLFTKKYKEAMRTRSDQSAKLGMLDDVASKTFHFIKEYIKPGLSFNLVRLKCKFHADAVGERDLTIRLRDMMDADLTSALDALDASSPKSSASESWLRSLVVGHLASLIEDLDDEMVDAFRRRLYTVLGESMEVLKTCSQNDSLSGLVHDLGLLEAVLSVGMGDVAVKFSEAVAAEKAINEMARLALLSKALGSRCGLELLAPLHQMKTTSVHDELAAQRFGLRME